MIHQLSVPSSFSNYSQFCVVYYKVLCLLHFFFHAHLRACNTTTLGPLTENLTSVAGTELAACAVPHVSIVTHSVFIQAASFGSGTFITTLIGTLHFSLTLKGSNTVCLDLQTKLLDETKTIQGAYKNASVSPCVHVSRER